MVQLNSFVRMAPRTDESAFTKTGHFRVAVDYLRHLECNIQDECNKQLRPIPPRCSLFTDGDSQCEGLGLHRASWEKLDEDIISAIKTMDEDETAIVPDWDFPPTHPQVDTSLQEIYGISQEDWAAAGPSQDASQHRNDVSETSYIDVVFDLEQSIPLHDAPEVFVVSKDGTITPVGTQKKPSG